MSISPNKKLHQIFDVVAKAMGAPDKNTVSSSFNLATCFSMLADGTTGPCREELVKFFGFSAVPKPNGTSLEGEVGATFQQLIAPAAPAASASKTPTAPSTLASMVKVAQALYASATVKESFSVQTAKNYHALVGKIDTANPATTIKAVNDFVAKATEGKINEILGASDVDATSVLVLVSALFFKGKWNTPFKKELTTERDFTLADGVTKKKVPTMFAAKMKDVNFIETGNIQALGMPYAGKELFFVAEAWTAESGRKGLPPSDFSNVMGAATGFGGETCDIYLPKFKIESRAALIPALKAAGVTNIFQATSNWQPVCDAAPLYVSVVNHRAVIEVDEEGTVAAAATAAVASRCAPKPATVVDFNRPFHFHIVDAKNKTILFSGSVVDPTA